MSEARKVFKQLCRELAQQQEAESEFRLAVVDDDESRASAASHRATEAHRRATGLMQRLNFLVK